MTRRNVAATTGVMDRIAATTDAMDRIAATTDAMDRIAATLISLPQRDTGESLDATEENETIANEKIVVDNLNHATDQSADVADGTDDADLRELEEESMFHNSSLCGPDVRELTANATKIRYQ